MHKDCLILGYDSYDLCPEISALIKGSLVYQGQLCASIIHIHNYALLKLIWERSFSLKVTSVCSIYLKLRCGIYKALYTVVALIEFASNLISTILRKSLPTCTVW